MYGQVYYARVTKKKKIKFERYIDIYILDLYVNLNEEKSRLKLLFLNTKNVIL